MNQPILDVHHLYSIEAEQMALGGVLINPESFEPVAAEVTAGAFFRRDHKKIFEAMEFMQTRGDAWDYGIVADFLEKTQPGEDWWPYIATIMKNTTGHSNVVAYASKVAEYAKLRALYQVGMKIQEISIDATKTLAERVSLAHDAINDLDAGNKGRGPRWFSEGMKTFLDVMNERIKSNDGVIGIRSGYESMDKRLGGLQPGKLIVIAGRPGMGKSVVGLNIASHVALNSRLPALYFSLEMPEDEIVGRVVAEHCSIPYQSVITGGLDDDKGEWSKLTMFVGRSKDSDLIIDDTAALSIGQIISRAKMINRYKRLSLIVIDHMHLIEAEGENEVIKLGKISGALKRLAKELGLPVVALCQLNRGCDTRADKKPMMADLRQSGSIEQDADVVAFIYRDVVYNENTNHPELMELVYRKVRGGQQGSDWFRSQLAFCRFVAGEEPSDVVERKPYSKRKADDL